MVQEFDEIANKGIFNKISYELAIAREMKSIVDPESSNPVAKILWDREIKLLERYRDHIAEWSFTRAITAREQLNDQIKIMIYERGNNYDKN